MQPNSEKYEQIVYSKEELDHYNYLVKTLCQMRDDREQPHPELDGMSYSQYYDSNRRKDLSYIPPKKNRQDIRIVTGTTREKDTTLLSTMLNMNFEPNVLAFDEDDMIINELGDNISDLVKKSREIEEYSMIRPILYRELISQGDVFCEEVYIEKTRKMPIDPINWKPADKDFNLTYNTKNEKVYEGCKVRKIAGTKVYLGDIRIEYIKNQPRVATLEIVDRDVARTLYGKWARWTNVPKDVSNVNYVFSDGITYRLWNIVTNNENQVCILKIYDKENNRFMIMLNGVMMLPYNYPLTEIRPDGDLPISQGKHEIISDFAYSKSQPSKLKVDQEVLDEITKLSVEAYRQGRKPPMASTGKKVYSSNIFMPGEISYDIKKDSLYPLLQNYGLNNADFSFYKLVKDNISDKSQNETFSGEQQQGDPTATQIMEEKNQQMLKLAASIDGIINLEKQLTWNRIMNILINWTKPIDQEVDETKQKIKMIYKQRSVKTTLGGGEEGYKVFRMTSPDEFPEEFDQYDEEEKLSKEYGMPVRIVYLNPKELRSLRCNFYIVINPTSKNNDQLSRLLFIQNISTAVDLFGPEALNQEYLKQKYAILIGEDPNKMFKKADLLSMLQQGQQNPPVTGNMKPPIAPAEK